MTTFDTGRRAEDAAASYLKNRSFKVIQQNFRTRYCEIDIVAEKDGVVYFVEVKYRLHSFQGDGLDYITPQKQKQMSFAAEMWVHDQKWMGEYCLAGVAVGGVDFVITDFIEL